METYIYLTDIDKKRLLKIAKDKQLSLSTCARIIIDHYWITIHHIEKYLYKGNNMMHIKIRNNYKDRQLNSMKCTNAIGMYFHNNLSKEKLNFTRLNRQIQSEMDKTIDPNANKNMEIRIAWRIKKSKLA